MIPLEETMTTQIERSPYAQAQRLPQHSTFWTGGFWKNRFDHIVRTMVPNMYGLFKADDIGHVIANFTIAAGNREGAHSGPAFSDGDFYKWLEAASYAYGESHDAHLKILIDNSVELIRRAQRKDGYIFTKQIIEDRLNNVPISGALSNSLNFEVYNMGHLMTTACVHYYATEEHSLLDIACKAADYLVKVFKASREGKAKTAICPSHYMGLVELYRTTGNNQYLEAAALAIALRDKVENGTDDNQDRIPLRQHKVAVGHAVRSNYLYAGVADLYAEQGDETLKNVLENVHSDVTQTKLYITGGCGAHYDGVSPYGSWDYDNIQRTHQSYGRAYELPNITAYNETCATIGNILWNWRMFCISPKAAYIDIIERSFYNLVLASTSIDGKKFFYQNALRREMELPFDLKWSRKRETYISSFCCPPNMLRTLAQSATYTYALGDDTVYLGMYGESSAYCSFPSGSSFVIEQKIDYPWDGKISLTIAEVQGSSPLTIQIRIPEWVDCGTIHLPFGDLFTIRPEMAGTYHAITRVWKDGDVITIHFPMEPKLMVANRLVEENNNHVAVQRGPVVYCIESCDFASTEEFHQIAIMNPPEFTCEKTNIEGLPVIAIQANALKIADLNSVTNSLYQVVGYNRPQSLRIRLVPYFTWDNRGLHAMKVWIPLHQHQ